MRWVTLESHWHYMAIGHLNDEAIAVVFVLLETKGVSVISMHPASRNERRLL